MGDANGSRGQTDWLDDQTDGSTAQMDAPSTLNKAETTRLSHNEGAGTYLAAARDVKCDVNSTDASTRQGDVSSIETKTNIPANVQETVRIPRKKSKQPDIPVEAASCAPGESNGLRDAVDMSSMCTDGHSIGDKTETAADKTEIVRMH